MKSIYVGNLPYQTTPSELSDYFRPYGTVHEVTLIHDRMTGRPRGFGFVRMDDQAAEAAVNALNGSIMGGRTLKVNIAREREQRPAVSGV